MALAPKTVLTYPLDGSNRDFTIPFEYLARKFVQVTLIGQDRKLLTLNIDYRFTQRTIITTTKPWGPADGYERIEIRRYTSATERLVDFSDGSILRAYDLNTSQVQSLHIAEEGRDVASDTIGVNNDGDLDARGRRIVNIADATNGGEAVTLRQNREWAESALNQANRATAQAGIADSQATTATQRAAAALVSQNAAKTSETNAKTSEANALASRNAAAGSDTTAAGSATAAAGSATAAAGSATAAAGSATTSKNEADRAKTEADKLATFNGMAAAVEGVAGTTVLWKGAQVSLGRYQVSNAGDASYSFVNPDGSNSVRWTRNAAGTMRLFDDSRSVERMSSSITGALTIPDTLRISSGGGVQIAQPTTGANAILGFYGPNFNRGIIYASELGSMVFVAGYGIPGSARIPVTITHGGALWTQAGIRLNDGGTISVDPNGNITAPMYTGGSLKKALEFYDTGFFAVTGSSQYDFTHGLFQAPVRYAIQIKCVVAEHGYAVGDIINCPVGLDYALSGLAYGLEVRQYNATTFNIYIGQALRAYAANKQNTYVAGPTPPNWHVRVIAYAT